MDWRGYLEELSDTFIDGGISGQIEGYKFYNGKTSQYTDEKTLKKWWQIDAGTSGPLYQPRDETKIYENPYVANWDIVNDKLSPVQVVSFKEKARYVDCANSNKYNITQTIAETFEVFCIYEYTCEPNGHFKKTYIDEAGDVWTGKKVIFFNRAVKSDNPYVINYQHNLNTISRTIDSSEVYTKMYINPIASETMDTGYVSIADTPLNPLLDDFILNFDYLYKVGSINDMQKAEIESYKVKLHKLNKKIIEVEEQGAALAAQLNELESLKAVAKASMESAQEQLAAYEKQMQSLADEPVIKNNSNAYPITFVPKESMNILQGTLRLEGINAATIVGYSDINYTKRLFSSGELIHAQNAPSDSNDKTNKWYITKDEYGYPETIFTSINNPAFKEHFGDDFNTTTGARIYLGLEYFPKNKYETICNSFEIKISIQRSKMDEYDGLIGNAEDESAPSTWSGLKKDIKINEQERLALYAEKDALNFRIERILGPALREGYWQPETYEDPGEGHNVALLKEKRNEMVDNTVILFDEELFEEEQKEYYYASSSDIDDDIRSYYSFIPLKNIYERIGNEIDENGKKRLVSDFSIVLFNPEYKWTTINKNTVKSGQSYYVLLDGKYYTFVIPNSNKVDGNGYYPAGIDLVIYTVDDKQNNYNAPYLKVDGIYTAMTLKDTKPEIDVSYNLTGAFMGSNQYLSSRHLYNGSDFQYSYFKLPNGAIEPVALLLNEDIDYNRYKVVKYSFDKGATLEDELLLEIKTREQFGEYKLVYPRIFIDYRNVNVESDNFKIYVTSDSKKLTNYEDYQILERNNRPYITLKVSDRQYPYYILNESYNIIFQVSRANEQLYLDAKQVAIDSSKPKYSYEIQIANIPGEINSLELGQLCHINDYSVDVYKEYGYISELKYALDKPMDDSVVVSNYKTKFEDLFSSISAQSEAMKQNRDFYNIALASFSSNGDVAPDVLQSTLDNNNFSFNFSDSNLQLDNTGGLVLTNLTPYANSGVYGQLALRGGGVYCSGSINDATGERNWETAITPSGINAKLITTGQLDTRLVRIMSGDEAAFQWNNEGLYAYRNQGTSGRPDFDTSSYVKLNENGLSYMLNGEQQLELGWNGLNLKSGLLELTAENGLQLFNKTGKDKVAIATFGKWDNMVGMRLCDNNGNTTLQTTSSGMLNLTSLLVIGTSDDTNYAGLCGTDSYKDSITGEYIRMWAGSITPTNAEFTVGESGAVKASRIVIPTGGSITFKNGSQYTTLNYETVQKLLALAATI